MLRTFRGTVDEHGVVRLLEPAQLPVSCQVLVTVIDDLLPDTGLEAALLSEAALAKDWLRPEEDEAWAHLQEEP